MEQKLSNDWLVQAVKDLLADHGKPQDELEMSIARHNEIVGAVYGVAELMPQPPPPAAPDQVSVGDIIRDCNEAAARMGTNNSHRETILLAASALQQLVYRLDKFENPPTGRM